ncbi:hypothetical protein Bbelb_385910 [Branchiostoma belcheri]|nr:hypothetical protein Bbelb_385910 [Branchiostoma belcheri]
MGVFATERRLERESFSPWQKLPRQQIVPRGGILLASLREKITPTPNKTAKEATMVGSRTGASKRSCSMWNLGANLHRFSHDTEEFVVLRIKGKVKEREIPRLIVDT